MAQPRKPQSTPPPPGGDDDLSLDDIEQRPQQRPRLPDQRTEREQFEMSGPPPAGKPSPAQAAVTEAEPRGWEPVSHEEIAGYEPAQAGSASARPEEPVAPATETPPSRSAKASPAGLDDLEEFIARTTSPGSKSEDTTRARRPFTLLEKVCSGAGAFVLLLLAVWLFRAVAAEANGVPAASEPWPDTPMKGELITISEATASWRATTETDRVAMMEVIMPVPGRQNPEFIPQVEFTLDGSASGSGFLRFIFRDSYGKPRGDTRVVQVDNGKLRSMDKGEIVKSDTEGSVYCSEGMLSIHAYYSYTGENLPRWSVEVAESASYGAADKEWKVLGTFDIRDELAK